MSRTNKKRLIFEYACYMFMMLYGLQLTGYQYSLIYISKEFSLSNTALGFLSSMQFLPNLIVPLFCGGLVDKYDKRKIAALCAAAYGTGSACILFSTSIGMLAAGIGILACGSAMAPAVLTTLLAEIEPERSNRYANMIEVFYSVGNVISPIGLSWLISLGMPWRGLYAVVMAGSAAVAITFSMVNVPSYLGAGTQSAEKKEIQKFRLDFLAWMLILFALLYNFIEPGFMTFASTYFTEVAGDKIGASISISVMGLMMVVSRMISSRLRGNKEKVMFVGTLGAAITGLLMVLFPIKGVAILWCALFGLLAGPCWPTMMSLAITCFPRNSGRITTLIMVGAGVGGFLLSPLMGMVSDIFNVAISYIVVVAAALLGALVVHLIYCYRKKQTSVINLDMNAG